MTSLTSGLPRRSRCVNTRPSRDATGCVPVMRAFRSAAVSLQATVTATTATPKTADRREVETRMARLLCALGIGVLSAAGSRPDAELRIASGVGRNDHGLRELDDDAQRVDPAKEVDARIAERARLRLRSDLRER